MRPPSRFNASVSGSSVDVPTRLVYRIDYMAGDERLRMWVNPAVPHPATAPNIDVIVPDHTWNEIRLQAGEGTINNSWEVDNLLLEVQGADPNLYVDVSSISVAAGGTQTMTHALGNQHTGSLYIVLGSLSGTSPGTPFGTATIPLNSDPYLTFTANFVNNNTTPEAILERYELKAGSIERVAGVECQILVLKPRDALALLIAATLIFWNVRKGASQESNTSEIGREPIASTQRETSNEPNT